MGSRCHLKHRTSQYMMTDSPSSDSLSAEMSQPATNPGNIVIMYMGEGEGGVG